MLSMYELKKTDEEVTAEPRKKCPFCAELIQPEAIKCRYCNEFLDGRTQPTAPSPVPRPAHKRMLHSTPALVIALMTAGPLALPLVWTNPRYNRFVKTAITCGVVFVTVALCIATYRIGTNMINQIKSLGIGAY